jgi:hypothetical protein
VHTEYTYRIPSTDYGVQYVNVTAGRSSLLPEKLHPPGCGAAGKYCFTAVRIRYGTIPQNVLDTCNTSPLEQWKIDEVVPPSIHTEHLLRTVHHNKNKADDAQELRKGKAPKAFQLLPGLFSCLMRDACMHACTIDRLLLAGCFGPRTEQIQPLPADSSLSY